MKRFASALRRIRADRPVLLLFVFCMALAFALGLGWVTVRDVLGAALGTAFSGLPALLKAVKP